MKKVIGLLLSLVLAASLGLAGCSNNTNSSDSNSESTDAREGKQSSNEQQESASSENITFPLREQVEISWIVEEGSKGTFNPQWKLIQEMEKQTNIKFEWLAANEADRAQKYDLMFAARDLPDIIFAPAKPKERGADGLLLDLKPYMDAGKMPNFKKLYDDMKMEKYVADDQGRVFMTTTIFGVEFVPWGNVYRKDLFAEVGVNERPQTWEQFYETGVKLKELYPDKYLYNVYNWAGGGALNNFIAPSWDTRFGMYRNQLADPNVMVYGPMEDSYKDMLAFLNKMYAAGLIDPEFSSNDGNVARQKLYSGRNIAIGVWVSTELNPGTWTAGKEADPDYALDYAWPPLKVPGKASKTQSFMPFFDGVGLSVSADSKNPDIAVALVDKIYSPEWDLMGYWGWEGETFEYNDEGLPVYKEGLFNPAFGVGDPAGESTIEKYGIGFSSMGFPMIQPLYVPQALNEPSRAFWEENIAVTPEVTVRPPMNPVISDAAELEEYTNIITDVNTYAEEMTLRFITGQESLDRWDSYLETLQGMGIERAVELSNKYMK